jgi:Tropinone reductase 1
MENKEILPNKMISQSSQVSRAKVLAPSNRTINLVMVSMIVFSLLMFPTTSSPSSLSSPISSTTSLWYMPKGSTAIVTGGTKGIGKAIVTELAKTFGCHVLTCSRSKESLEKCLQGEWKGLNVEGIVADVSTSVGREAMVQRAKEIFSSKTTGNDGTDGECLDILVNNVGTNIRKPTTDYSLDETKFLLDTNFHSMFELSKLFYPLLKKKSQNDYVSKATSSIVNIGSVAGVTCLKTGTPYAATKAAMNQLTANLGEISFHVMQSFNSQ